jgi:hypothetical protein
MILADKAATKATTVAECVLKEASKIKAAAAMAKALKMNPTEAAHANLLADNAQIMADNNTVAKVKILNKTAVNGIVLLAVTMAKALAKVTAVAAATIAKILSEAAAVLKTTTLQIWALLVDSAAIATMMRITTPMKLVWVPEEITTLAANMASVAVAVAATTCAKVVTGMNLLTIRMPIKRPSVPALTTKT